MTATSKLATRSAVADFQRGRRVILKLMKPTESATRFLESLQRYDLAKLIAECRYEVRTVRDYGFGGNQDVFVLSCPRPISDALVAVDQYDKKRVGEALSASDPDAVTVWDAASFQVEVDDGTKPGPSTLLLAELILQRETMIKVATGGLGIQDVNDYYIAREVSIRATASQLGIEYENPHADLWNWYHHWKENFGTYQERRTYVRDLVNPAIRAAAMRSVVAAPSREPTGWDRVDRALFKARDSLERARTEEDFQTVGLLCREVLISLAQAVFVPGQHQPLDGVTPSPTDAKRMMEAYLHEVVPGDTFKEVRAHARASYDLSTQLQHRRTADRKLAALCLEATSSTVHVISILSRT